MQLIDEATAEAYLRERALVGQDEDIGVRELAGGVSNVVLLVTRTDGDDFVLKQAREQLRVPEPWFCSIERIWREVETLQVCTRVLQSADTTAKTPEVTFVDRENYVFAMTAAPAHDVWKQRLLAGDPDGGTAAACGDLLGALHAGTWHDADTAQQLDDRSFFEDLRIDPYYRQVARVHTDLAPAIDALIASVDENRHALVHGDFSPKNLLLFESGLMLVDFEVGHYGDPAFDLGFFLTHLVLKSIWATDRHDEYLSLTDRFWSSYEQRLLPAVGRDDYTQLTRRAVSNLAGCMLARVDGKSQVEYLDEQMQAVARQLATSWLLAPPASWSQVTEEVDQAIGA